MKFLILLSLSFALSVNCETITVSNDGQLNDALTRVNPGDTIQLQDGSYWGTFETSRSGNSGAPITLVGSRGAVLGGPNYGFWLKGNYWILQGFSINNAKKGIVVEGASNNILENLDVGNIQQEGVHFRWGSTDNILRDSTVYNTGTSTPGFGEGVYIGQAINNWQNGEPDRSDRNQVINNHIGPNVAAESLDIKEGSCCGEIRGNTFDGTGETGENYSYCLVNVKGDNYVVEDNYGTHPYRNAYEVNYISAAGVGGCNNVIQNNKCNSLPSGGQCAIDSHPCSNTLSNNVVE